MKYVPICLAAALISLSLPAQSSYYIPDNVPSSGGCNVIPFGTTNTSATWVNQRYQTLVTPSELAGPAIPVRICSLGFAPCGAQVHQSDEMTITMAQKVGTLTTSFAGNLAINPIVVYKGTCHVWQLTDMTWNNIGLQKIYPYVPGLGNLVIDILIKGNHRKAGTGLGFHTGSKQRLFAYNWTTTAPATGTLQTAALKMRIQTLVGSLDDFGMGCGPGPLNLLASGNPKSPGGSVAFNMTGGPASGVGFIWLGLTAFPNPINIDPPYTGCKINCSFDLVVPVSFSTGGRSTGFKIPIPAGLGCFQFCAQGLAVQPAAPGGISVSDWTRVLIGL